jgi:hypothetical protein|tara:strand:- start:405 stop:812 length:408 start_codon:yes stop_codon:yes gene_type:complete
MTNSRNKGASFEREIANNLNESLNLKKPLKRILEQTREKHLPDLILGNWFLECKRYGQGAEPLESWWDQVIKSTPEGCLPALIYKFNHRPIKVRIPLYSVNRNLQKDFSNTCDISLESFIFLIKSFYMEDIKDHL